MQQAGRFGGECGGDGGRGPGWVLLWLCFVYGGRGGGGGGVVKMMVEMMVVKRGDGGMRGGRREAFWRGMGRGGEGREGKGEREEALKAARKDT